VRYITERAVFELRPEGVTLIEVAEGLDVQRDVVDQMGFVPQIAEDLGPIDPRVYRDDVMGLAR
jgi:propionate CoA-transferase